MRLATIGLALSSLVTSISSQTVYPGELGYWDVNITSVRSAAGYEGEEVTAVHSMTPDNIITQTWQYDPSTGKYSAERTGRSFNYEIKGGCGVGFSGKSRFPPCVTKEPKLS